MEKSKNLKWETPSLIKLTNHEPEAASGIPPNCNPTGQGAAECFTGYGAIGYCGPGGAGPGPG